MAQARTGLSVSRWIRLLVATACWPALASAGVEGDSKTGTADAPTYTVYVEIVVETARGAVKDLRREEVVLRQQNVPQQISLRSLEKPGHYEISYRPSSGQPGPITLAIRRPQAAARGPRGGALQPRTVRNRSALEQSLFDLRQARPDANDFPLLVSAFEFDATADAVRCAIVSEVPLGRLTQPGMPAPSLQLLARVLSGDREIESLSVDLGARSRAEVQERLVWSGDLRLAPGTYSVEVVAREPGSDRASVRSLALEVGSPAPGLRISSLVTLQPTRLRVQTSTKDSDSPLEFGDRPVMVSLEPRASAAMALDFFVMAYPDPASTERASLQLEIYRGEELVTTSAMGSPSTDANGGLRYFGRIQARTLNAGDYRARIVARQGSAFVSREGSFHVLDVPVATGNTSVEDAFAPRRPEVIKASALMRTGRSGEAVAVLKALDRRTEGGCEDACLLALAAAYVHEGAYKDAEVTAQRVLARKSEPSVQAQAWELIARSRLAGVKKPEENARLEAALEALTRVLELTEGRSAYATVARLVPLLKLGRRAEAQAIVEQVEKAQTLSAVDLAAARRLLEEPRCVDEPCAPDIAFAAEGEHKTLADLRGKAVLITFWAQWCPPCMAALPELAEIERRFSKEPFVLIGVNADQDAETMKAVLARFPLAGPQVWDGTHQVAGMFGVYGWPMEIVLDHDGVIVHRQGGWIPGGATSTQLSQQIRRAVDAAKKAAKTRASTAGR